VHEKASRHLEPFLLLSDRNPWATMNSAVPDRYSALEQDCQRLAMTQTNGCCRGIIFREGLPPRS
jgi:hypothetical protein